MDCMTGTRKPSREHPCPSANGLGQHTRSWTPHPRTPALAAHPARAFRWRRARAAGVLLVTLTSPFWPAVAGASVTAAAAAVLEPGAGPQALQIHYQHRPPYSEDSEAGPPTGLLVARAKAALLKAGVAHQWVRTPGQRQFALIQSGQGLDCGLGWFRSPERETRGRFTRAIYQDQPFVALVRRETGMQPLQPLSDWLGRTELPLLVKDGYSYGPVMDARIAALAANDGPLRRTTAESTQMVRMIAAGRAGWMLSTPEEAEVLLRSTPEVANRLALLAIAGAPAGNSRHLYCSLAVPEAVIQRIDRALEEVR